MTILASENVWTPSGLVGVSTIFLEGLDAIFQQPGRFDGNECDFNHFSSTRKKPIGWVWLCVLIRVSRGTFYGRG